MKLNATLKSIENKTYNGYNFISAKVIFEGADYPCFITVKTDKDINSFKADSTITLDLSFGAYNYKPVYKYTII